MAFVLTRPGSPSSTTIQDDDTLPRASSSPQLLVDHDMDRSHLEIILHSQYTTLKGTGVDVEPAHLAGHVLLFLTQATSIKEITLQFRGKSRSPVPNPDSLINNTNSSTHILCNRDWSFLEGDKTHTHTLKAGRHIFPFQLQIDGSLPSTISTPALGGASVAYKLRALAIRPGLSHNLQAIAPVTILRSFTPEALEYQQTLEIENTWPEKLMYSLMVPHKAWAAGDRLSAVVKFSPIVKGCTILSVTTTIQEITKTFVRSGTHEDTKFVASIKHHIIRGRAVEADQDRHSTSNTTTDDGVIAENNDIVTQLDIPIPTNITPSHSLEPILVSHRIRWSILIRNLDGHTSELRCSLPLHLLDHRLLQEARAHTSATRRLVLGTANNNNNNPSQIDEDRQLPSYTAHVRDRVANMFLPEAATLRVTNPWLTSGMSPTHSPADNLTYHPSDEPNPLEVHLLSHLPPAPRSGDSTPLDWVNSELLLSLSGSPPPIPRRASSTPPDSGWPTSHPHSRASTPDPSAPSSPPHDTYVHPHGHATRQLHSFFKATMKPFTSFSNHHSLFSSSSSSSSSSRTLPHTPSTPPSSASISADESRSSFGGSDVPAYFDGPALLHRAFTEVPDYSIASRGFIGGVPPLTSMRGLPSYEQAAEERMRSVVSEPDIAGRFARARDMGVSSSSSSDQEEEEGLSMHTRTLSRT